MLKPGEALSMRGRQQDRLAVALLVDHKHMQFAVDGGFDGVYTHFAAEGFSFGSTFRNWAAISIIIHSPTKPPLIPSFGRSYNDLQVRPWKQGGLASIYFLLTRQISKQLPLDCGIMY